MSFQPGAGLYTQGFGTAYENIEVPHNDVRPPNVNDTQYPIGKRWLDTVGLAAYVLVGQTSIGGVLQSIWLDDISVATVVNGTTQQMITQGQYVPNNAGLVTLTLPAVATVGQKIQVVGYGSGGWIIAQNAGQTIHSTTASTTTGTGGSLASTNRYNSVELMNVVANTDWTIMNFSGTLTTV